MDTTPNPAPRRLRPGRRGSGCPRRPGDAARPRGDRGQHLPRHARPTRTASGCSADRSPDRHWSPRHARSTSRGRHVHSLHAYFLRPGDPTRADPLRGRPDPRRPQLLDPARRGDPARQGDLQPPGQLPRRRAGPRSPDHDAAGHAATPRTSPDFQTRMAPYAERMGEWYDRPRPIDHRYVDGDPMSQKGTPSTDGSTCGSGPTAHCRTTRCCTRASSPTPAT